MADDSVSPPPVADNTSPAPVAPPDQTAQSTDIGQQPEGTWPNSTNLANDQLPADSNLANNSQATPAVESVVAEPPKEESQLQAPSPEVGQVAEIQPETTWPDSTKMAKENSADTSTSANPAPPTDQAIVSADSPIPSIPPVTPVEPVSSVLVGSPPTPSSPSSPPEIPTSVPASESPTPEVTPEPSEATKPPEENIQSPDNQAPQVQPEAPNEVPITDTEKPQDNMANFKPEPPEQPKVAPLANQNVTDSGQKSFGDLLSSENQPPPTPSTPSIPPIPSTPTAPSVPSVPSSPSISFGDLIKDLKPEESVIPPPPIPSEPAIPSSPPPQNPSSSSPTSPPPPLISPIPNLPPIANIPPISQIPSAPSDQLSLRRQKANQVRSQKKTNHLNKIMELAKNAKSISNTDVQRLLHVSQSTATNYLSELSRKGLLKKQGIRGGAKYSL